jgi:hypothetical protein
LQLDEAASLEKVRYDTPSKSVQDMVFGKELFLPRENFDNEKQMSNLEK